MCGKRNCPVDLCLIFVISMKERRKKMYFLVVVVPNRSIVIALHLMNNLSLVGFSLVRSLIQNAGALKSHYHFSGQFFVCFILILHPNEKSVLLRARCICGGVCVRKSPRFCQPRAVDRLTVPSHGDRSRKLGERAANVIYQLDGGLLIDELM